MEVYLILIIIILLAYYNNIICIKTTKVTLSLLILFYVFSNLNGKKLYEGGSNTNYNIEHIINLENGKCS